LISTWSVQENGNYNKVNRYKLTTPTVIEIPRDFFFKETKRTITAAMSLILSRLKDNSLFSVKMLGQINAAKILAGINFIHSLNQLGRFLLAKYVIGKLRGIYVVMASKNISK